MVLASSPPVGSGHKSKSWLMAVLHARNAWNEVDYFIPGWLRAQVKGSAAPGGGEKEAR